MAVAVFVADSDPSERAAAMVGVWARPRGQDNILGWLQVVPVCGTVLYEPLPCAPQVRDRALHADVVGSRRDPESGELSPHLQHEWVQAKTEVGGAKGAALAGTVTRPDDWGVRSRTV